jgi:hypothetical protein
LAPLLEKVGVVARGQLEAIVQRNKGDGLTFARTVACALDGEGTENGSVVACVGLYESLCERTVGECDLWSDVAGALELEELGEGLASEIQKLVPDVPLDIVCGSSLLCGVSNEDEKFIGQGKQCRGIGEFAVVCDHESRPSWLGNV